MGTPVIKVDDLEDFGDRRPFNCLPLTATETITDLDQLAKARAFIDDLSRSQSVPSSSIDHSSPETPVKPKSAPVTPRKRTEKSSHYFATPSPVKKARPLAGTVSCLEAPPLCNPTFGLIQEELADNPFQLLVVVIFLNRTRGSMAIPLFREVIKQYPTPTAMADVDAGTLAAMVQKLGLHNQRALTLLSLARSWEEDPPQKGRRFRTNLYPSAKSSKDITHDEILSNDDPREGAFEVGHLPGLGAYAYDSWRIFCRDKLRGLAEGWNGEGAGSDFEPEWKKVLPKDKELKACLRWLWLKEGWKWDPKTGEKEVATEDLMKKAQEGGLVWKDENTASPLKNPLE